MSELREKIGHILMREVLFVNDSVTKIKGQASITEELAFKLADKILPLMPHWISVEEILPERGQMVALMDTKSYANNGDLQVDNEHVVQAGYLNEFGHKYWSVYGERGLCLDAFTHWMPLPQPPKEG